MEKLPYDNFEWLTEEEITALDIENYDVDGDEGMILEVDLDYPAELHDQHADFPLAPEHLVIKREMLSPAARQFMVNNNHQFTQQTRLAPNLYNKTNYIVHVKNLQFYLQMGMKLRKIHRALKFNQCTWLKSYIEFCTKKRQQATNDQEKDFYKLFINCIFGKLVGSIHTFIAFLYFMHS